MWIKSYIAYKWASFVQNVSDNNVYELYQLWLGNVLVLFINIGVRLRIILFSWDFRVVTKGIAFKRCQNTCSPKVCQLCAEVLLILSSYTASPENLNYMLDRMVGRRDDKHCDDVMRISTNTKGTYWWEIKGQKCWKKGCFLYIPY